MTSRPWLDFVHPDDHDITIAEGEKLFAGVPTIAFENRYRHKNGGYRWMLWSVRTDPVEKRLYCIARDITDRRLLEQQLRQARPQGPRHAAEGRCRWCLAA